MNNEIILERDVQKHLVDIVDIFKSNILGIKSYSYSLNKSLKDTLLSIRVNLLFKLNNGSAIRIVYIEFIQDGFHYYKLVDKEFAGVSFICRGYDAFLKFWQKIYSEMRCCGNE